MKRWIALGLLACLTVLPSWAQDFSSVEVRTTRVADGVWVLEGRGGNIGLVVGEYGAFVIDDQYAPLTEKILAAIRAVTDQPVKFVFNTHWHGDHTGGNENMAAAGALIVAHENVRKRLSAGQFMAFFQRDVPPAPDGALPIVTFNDRVSFHLGGHTVRAVHVPPAHTDGDAIVHLVEADVIHGGDLVFSGMYPFIDYDSGGSLAGMIAAVDRILEIAGDHTRIITGHGGPVIGVEQLRAYREMLATVHGRLRSMIDKGKSLEEVLEARPTAEFDEAWGNGFLKAAQWVELNYRGMSGQESAD